MTIDLAQLTRRQRNVRRSAIMLRDIPVPATLATDLFRGSYLPIIQIWERAAPRIIEAYGRALSDLTTDSPADIQAQIDGAGSEFDRIVLELRAELERWALRVERYQRAKWTSAILSATGVDLRLMIGPEGARETLETYMRWNAALIRDVSDQIRQRVSSAVFAGVQNRRPVRDVAKTIREATGMGRTRSMGIAADQTSKTMAALADERAQEVGLTAWKWRHSGKRHPRQNHKVRNGNLYSSSAATVGKTVEGETVMAEPEASDQPGRPPWCGCRKQFVVVFD